MFFPILNQDYKWQITIFLYINRAYYQKKIKLKILIIHICYTMFSYLYIRSQNTFLIHLSLFCHLFIECCILNFHFPKYVCPHFIWFPYTTFTKSFNDLTLSYIWRSTTITIFIHFWQIATFILLFFLTFSSISNKTLTNLSTSFNPVLKGDRKK